LAELPDRDPGTGLPRLMQALADLARLRQEIDNRICHGLVILSLQPNASLLRLTPETHEILRREVSWRLAGVLREQDRLYVLGSEEWLALLPRLPSPAAISLAMLKLHRVFHQPPLEINGEELGIQAICGAAICPDHGNDPQHLIQSARIAALHSNPKNEWASIYRHDMEQGNIQHVHLARKLNDALREDRLQLFLQPQVDIHDQCCRHAEALLRWQHPSGEWINPAQTIEILEKSGLRPNFNRWLFQRAALYLSSLRDTHKDMNLSINLTANDLLDPEVPDLLAQALSTWNLPTDNLTLEITETVAVQESRAVEKVLRQLRAMNVRLSIDDFGTGYAGIAYLQHLPVQEIKIDKRFILPLATSSRDQDITRSIIELAHKLNLQVVAEGVETPEALEYLQQMRCERIQGYLYSPALPMETFLDWLEAHQTTKTQATQSASLSRQKIG
jgi:EAL domain-containing protein (putative c-di-GMP-specific phosphodiesterase class I)/GGDEF domain-containing protein